MKEINVKHGFRYRIYPTEEQKKYFAKAFAANRWWWNYQLEKVNKHYEETKEHLSCQYKIARELPSLKKDEETSWLKDVDAISYIYTSQSLDAAFAKFFKKQGGYPKFKRRGYSDSYTIQVQSKCQNVVDWSNNTVKIGKAGVVKAVLHKKFNGVIKAITVSKKSYDYYEISILFDDKFFVEEKPKDSIDCALGVDLGIKENSNAILSDGAKYHVADKDKKLDKRIRRMQKRLAKKEWKKTGRTVFSKKWNKEVEVKEPSKNYLKLQEKIAKLKTKEANRRSYNSHIISSQIANSGYGIVCIEDLNVSGMVRNHHIARSISHANMGEIKRQLQYKTQWNGQELVQVDRFYPSSQVCHCCGYKNAKVKNLSVRKWVCPNCGAEHDRDVNAAINIRNEGYRIYSEGKQKK